MADNSSPRPIELLYEAALQGNVFLLQDLLLRDPFLLHRPLPPSQSNTSPLHVACKLGHTFFVLELLHRNPNLAEEFDPNDKSSLLHLAARNGHLELVKSLISFNPSLCFARDMSGRNPVHLAAIKGQLHVLEELLRATPAAARERVGLLLGGSGGDTILHLCVKFNQLEALKLSVRMVGHTQMLNSTDDEGNTILHVAVANKNPEIVEFLLNERRLKKSSLNSNGLTAKDVFDEIPKEFSNNVDVDVRLRLALKREKALSSKRVKTEEEKGKYLKWIEKQRSTLMIVASLIATMAFQAGINPPGGVWQDNGYLTTQKDATTLAPPPVSSADWHDAGTSVMAQLNSYSYDRFFMWNTIGFILSMSSILLLISGLPCRRFFMGSIMVTMWGAVAAVALTYGFSSFNLTSDSSSSEDNVIITFTLSWIGVMGLLLLGHFIHWPIRFIKYLRKR